MAGTPMRLDLDLRQAQVMSPLQQQSLAVLALPLPELRDYIQGEIQDYPLLEVRAPQNESLTAIVDQSEHRRETPRQFDAATRRQAGSAFRSPDGEWLDPLQFLGTHTSFTEDLLQQVSLLDLERELHDRCVYIIYSLSSRGYLQDSEEDLARQMGCSVQDARQAIFAVQSLLPTGVAARDLTECLLLQLAQSAAFNKYTVRIAKDHLQDLAAGRYDKIARSLGISGREAQRWCAEIRKLNPIPSEGYHGEGYTQFVVPEASVALTEEGLTVQMNQDAVPEVVLPEEYLALMCSPADPSAQKFLKDHAQRAQLLKRQIDMRQTTLEKLILTVARLQPDFFRDGERNLRPMTMQQVAELLSVHTSTVSRAVNGKYINTPHGTVALRSLFTAAMTVDDRSVSTAAVKNRLRELIAQENKAAPLSDGELCGILQAQRVQISRRSVANYRKELGIPTASVRRRNE